MMSARDPNRSSSLPEAKVAMPATTFAAMANRMTWDALKPNTCAAMIPPNVNTPPTPSRKTALAMRNDRTLRRSRQSRATSRPRSR